MLITLDYHFVCEICRNLAESSCSTTWKHSEAPIHGMAWLFRGVPDSWDSWQRLKAKRSRMRKPTGRHRSDGSSASDSPRATYARVLVRSLARLIIQLISPGHSPPSPTHSRELRATCSPYSQQITTHLLGMQSLIFSRPKARCVARQRFFWFCGNFNFKINLGTWLI